MNYPFLEYDMNKYFILKVKTLQQYQHGIETPSSEHIIKEKPSNLNLYQLEDFLINNYGGHSFILTNSKKMALYKEDELFYEPIPEYDIIQFKRYTDEIYVAYYKEDYIRKSLFE